MRGERRQEDQLFSYIPLEDRVPTGHPLRAIRAFVDPLLKELSPRFDAIYSRKGRPSIPPEQLLRVLLQALYSATRLRTRGKESGASWTGTSILDIRS